MIKASFKLFQGDKEIMDESVNGANINSALFQVKRKINTKRKEAHAAGEPDPLRNWSGLEVFVSKFRPFRQKQETTSDVK